MGEMAIHWGTGMARESRAEGTGLQSHVRWRGLSMSPKLLFYKEGETEASGREGTGPKLIMVKDQIRTHVHISYGSQLETESAGQF